ncbi:hypothetical protein ACLKA6_009667 [Drosophila palustris]
MELYLPAVLQSIVEPRNLSTAFVYDSDSHVNRFVVLLPQTEGRVTLPLSALASQFGWDWGWGIYLKTLTTEDGTLVLIMKALRSLTASMSQGCDNLALPHLSFDFLAKVNSAWWQ